MAQGLVNQPPKLSIRWRIVGTNDGVEDPVAVFNATLKGVRPIGCVYTLGDVRLPQQGLQGAGGLFPFGPKIVQLENAIGNVLRRSQSENAERSQRSLIGAEFVADRIPEIGFEAGCRLCDSGVSALPAIGSHCSEDR